MMQSAAIVFKTDVALSQAKEFRVPSGAIVSSTSSPQGNSAAMRPPPPPPPPKPKEIKQERGHHEEPSSSIPDLEFDGTTVLCRVCGDKASGFHYGVHSCEGCKGFFRRSIQQKIQYRPCTKNQQCSILRINRNRCQYCRLKKCIAVGMSRDAVRFGRVPKREKARILAAMQQSCSSRSLEKAISAELEDEQRLLATVIRAHIDTCDFTRDKVEPMLLRAREQPSYTACPPTLACPLNPNPQPLSGQQELLQDFSKRFSPAIRGVVEFAKRIPGFALLAQDDQVTLLKAGVFEVLLVRLACMFDSQTSSMICLNGQVLKRESIHNSSNARFLMDSMFDFAERMNSLRLTDAEIGLFCSVVVIAADRPGLRNTELIEKMHNKLKSSLQAVVNQNHPGQQDILHELMKKVPDLRTLNTLHSEKLLAYKMTEQQQMMQQQQQIWGSPLEEDGSSKSPAGSTWSSSSDVTMDEAKSPMGSVSSTESMCSNEMVTVNGYDHQNIMHHISPNVANAPLLAATLAGGLCPHRHRANSGSTSSSGDDELAATSHLINNGLTITPVTRPHISHPRFRKLDSPSDSGIESGTEKLDKPSAPTSLCSSPRSSVEDQHIVEDMPVLKRVLQAPPLYDTNSLMDEAYKPHKKFRALRNKDTAEAEALVQVASPPAQSQLHLQLTQPSSLSSTHSTLAKSLMEGPRMTAEQMKRTDIIHNYIMRGESVPTSHVSGSSHVSGAPHGSHMSHRGPHGSHTSHLSSIGGAIGAAIGSSIGSSHGSSHGSSMGSPHLSPRVTPSPHGNASPHVSGSLSGPHSSGSHGPHNSHNGSLNGSHNGPHNGSHNGLHNGSHNGPHHGSHNGTLNSPISGSHSSASPHVSAAPTPCPYSKSNPNLLQPAWATSVITTTSRQPHIISTPPPQTEYSRVYLHPQQSPHSTSPAPPQSRSPATLCRSPISSNSTLLTPNGKMVELQLDIADSQQPLNLSKKSPSPSPRPHVVTLEV